LEYKHRLVNTKNWIWSLFATTFIMWLGALLWLKPEPISIEKSNPCIYKREISIGLNTNPLQFKNSIELPSLPLSPQYKDVTLDAQLLAQKSNLLCISPYFSNIIIALVGDRSLAYIHPVPVYLRYCQFLL
jgi:hypothetical protein